MILAYAASLPDEDAVFPEDWAFWQVEMLRHLVFTAAYKPMFFAVDGCIEMQSGDIPTGPDEHIPPDSIGVFYSDGDEDEAERWTEFVAEVAHLVKGAVDWGHIRPSAVSARARRLGIYYHPAFVPEKQGRGVVMTKQEVAAMVEAFEARKNDICRLELVRNPMRTSYLFDHYVFSYTRLMIGWPPEGIRFQSLWRRRHGSTGAEIGKSYKMLAGWGLDFEDECEEQARAYAEAWRFAFYTIVGGVDWTMLDMAALKDVASRLGLLEP